ncbi:class I tRNA ligase family protein [Mycoplasmopsis columbinasalis]|uniref:Cysteine--tRNA ligase n=1 Tax=Mycoplasmopsis columbinasalis TaxID=114880 RepID=A0A449BA97_9BACT|nr:class I tRNA ligase family protein [Mycoplasmopsis columbinasalis]VEU78105.1 Cysteine--tRNA ligase [Mycoplasmopsis columbinasalis]
MNKNFTKIYVCGPTVYNYVHIGNLRPILTYDLVLKAYRALEMPFVFVHNLTDIDDKIIKKAIVENKSELEVSEFFGNNYLDLLKKLNVDTVTHVEKVTDNFDVITDYIQKILAKKRAYADAEQNIWFDIKSCQEHYGIVSNQNLDKMHFEEFSSQKKFDADFALWKNTTEGIKYESPFGKGRPGWHTECCALIAKHFGEAGVDFHGGGMDLTFPHHENENIQHFAIYGRPLAKEWLRTGQINLDGIKMSKSLGNIVLANDFLAKHDAEILKLIFLSSKLTAQINVTDELIDNMYKIKEKYVRVIFKAYINFEQNFTSQSLTKQAKVIFEALKDFDFAKYNLLLNEALKDFNKNDSDFEKALTVTQVLGNIHKNLVDKNNYNEDINIYKNWQELLQKKQFAQADELRAKLLAKNLI